MENAIDSKALLPQSPLAVDVRRLRRLLLDEVLKALGFLRFGYLGWRGFQNYLQRVIFRREPARRPDAFERYLAYAAAFGLGQEWVSYFQKMRGVSLPPWFHSLSASFDPMLNLIDSMLPISSSDGGDGGGGASGGGSSGAG